MNTLSTTESNRGQTSSDWLMTLEEVAEFLRCSVKKVRRLIGNDAVLPCIKVRGSVLVWHSKLMNYLEGLQGA
jgi:excisionase family DNA binding protein